MNRKEKLKNQYVFYAALALLPALLYALWLSLMHFTGSPASPVPAISDELFWYHQITGMVDSGLPLGYYGYNGLHAPIGTCGPWGIAILLPYALWGKLFGFGLHSMSHANVAFLGLSLCLFALMIRMSRREFPYVAIGYATLLLNLSYSMSSMAEPLRWSLAILLTGCMIRIYRGYCGPVFRYLVVPLFLFYSCEAYLLLTLFLPVYLMLVLPIRRPAPRLAVSAGVTAVSAYCLRKLLFLTVSPLAVGSRTASSLRDLILQKLSAAWHVISYLLPSGLMRNRNVSFGFPSLFLLAFELVFLAGLALCIFLLKKHGIREILHPEKQKPDSSAGVLLSLYLMLGALGGYCLIYRNPSLWTVCRGLNTAFACAVLLLALYRSKKITTLCVVVALAALPSFYQSSQDNLQKRNLTGEEMELYETAREEFDGLFRISKEQTPWENTIAQYGRRQYGTQTALTLAMPRSAGYNVISDNTLITEAGYALVFNSFSDEKEYQDLLKRLRDNGYSTLYEHETLTVLTRLEY